MYINVLPFCLFILFFFLISYYDILPIKNKRKVYHIIVKWAVLVLIVFAGCRWSSKEAHVDTGIFDYDTYKGVFLNPQSLEQLLDPSYYDEYSFGVDKGYLMYSSLMSNLLGNHYNLYLFITNFILVYLLCEGFKKNRITCGLLFVFFFYASRLYLQYNFILLRQSIAMMIIWYAYHFIIRGEIKKYYLFCFLAVSFHFTAIVGFLAPLFLRLKLSRRKFIIIASVLFVLSVSKILDAFYLSSIHYLLSSFNSSATERLTKYLISDSVGANLLNFIEAVPFFYISFSYSKRLLSTKEGTFFYNMQMIYILLLMVTMNFSFLTRLSHYFMYSYIFMLSYFFGVSSPKARMQLGVLFSFYLLLYALRYNFIWFNNDDFSFVLLHI